MTERLCSKETLAERIFSLRRERGWSRAQLARISGASEMAIYNIEHALFYPRLESLDVICAALGVTLGEALCDDLEKESTS